MIGVYVSQFKVEHMSDMVLAAVLIRADILGDDAIYLLTQQRIRFHVLVQRVKKITF